MEEIRNYKLNNFYSSPYIKGEWYGRTCSTHGGDEYFIRSVVRKTWKKETTWEIQVYMRK